MNHGRIEHNLIFLDEKIYAIGGYTNEGQITSTCEVYSAKENKWTLISDMPAPCINASVCTFRNRWIYKFGGKRDSKILNERIDRYDSFNNTWENI